MEHESACDWAVRIYERLKADLTRIWVTTWYNYDTLLDCTSCDVERGCCKKTKLTLAMTSQILDFLKRYQEVLSGFGCESQALAN